MTGNDRAAGSHRGKSGVGPKKKKQQQQEPWTEEIWLKRCAMMHAYLLRGAIGIGALALGWSTVVLLGGFVTVLGKKDFWCLTFISTIQATGSVLSYLHIYSPPFLGCQFFLLHYSKRLACWTLQRPDVVHVGIVFMADRISVSNRNFICQISLFPSMMIIETIHQPR